MQHLTIRTIRTLTISKKRHYAEFHCCGRVAVLFWLNVDILRVDTMSVVLPYVVGPSHEEANNENKIIRMLKITSASDQDF